MPLAKTFKELRVWQNGMDLAMVVFELSKRFPADERYSMVDQIRRASRSVPSNIAEGWRKRRYTAAFRAKLNDAEGEAAEVQTHIELARRCRYANDEAARDIDARCEEILGQLGSMIRDAAKWCEGFGPV
jgi:four helix bundle protein